jgi:hypothetical protein
MRFLGIWIDIPHFKHMHSISSLILSHFLLQFLTWILLFKIYDCDFFQYTKIVHKFFKAKKFCGRSLSNSVKVLM